MAIISNPAIKKGGGFFIALTGWFALTLQFYVMLNTNRQNGIPVITTVFNFLGYFTILSNLLVATSLSIVLLSPGSTAGRFFSKYSVQSGIALYILIVGIVYSLALRNIWNPQGLQLLADRLLHDLIPVLYFFFWLLVTPKKVLRWKHIGCWLIFPLLYLVYSLVRGAVTNWYPYYFINAQEKGYDKVTINILLVLAAFIITGCLLVGINRLGKARR